MYAPNFENIAGIPGAKSVWEIPRDGTPDVEIDP